MRLRVFRVSGNRLKTKAYRTKLSKYSFPRGENRQKKQYLAHQQKWLFCHPKQIDILNTNVNYVLEFFNKTF